MAHGVPATHPEEKGALNRSPRANYVEKRGGLPFYVNAIAVALVREGMDRSRAIATARNSVTKTCATGHWGGNPQMPVSAAIRAEACKAVAALKRLDASAPKRKGIELTSLGRAVVRAQRTQRIHAKLVDRGVPDRQAFELANDAAKR